MSLRVVSCLSGIFASGLTPVVVSALCAMAIQLRAEEEARSRSAGGALVAAKQGQAERRPGAALLFHRSITPRRLALKPNVGMIFKTIDDA